MDTIGHAAMLRENTARHLARDTIPEAVKRRIKGLRPSYHNAKTTRITVDLARPNERQIEYVAPVAIPPQPETPPSPMRDIEQRYGLVGVFDPPRTLRASHDKPNMREIVEIVAERSKITMFAIYSASRLWRAAHPRQIAMLLIRQIHRGDASTMQMGRHFRRDHTTIMHGIKKGVAYVANDDDPMAVVYRLARADTIARWPGAFQ